jgi:chloramphenicol 3-O phosphotransferase
MLLNGSPSAGKTTLARAVQATAPMPLFHRSLDDFLAGYLPRYRAADDGTLFGRVLKGYVHALADLAVAGNDIVAEAVIIPEWRELYAGALAAVPVLLVGVRCRLEVAQDRERARTDRPHVDLDVAWFDTVHDLDYDVEVDTSDDPQTDVAAARLVSLFLDPPTERAFVRLLT